MIYELIAELPPRGFGFQIKATLFLVTSVTRGAEGGPGRRLGSGTCIWRSAPFSEDVNMVKEKDENSSKALREHIKIRWGVCDLPWIKNILKQWFLRVKGKCEKALHQSFVDELWDLFC